MASSSSAQIDITVATAIPKGAIEIPLQVEADCTVIRAIRRSGILERFPDIRITEQAVGIFSKKVALDALLQAGDRIEIYHPLLCDPKQARKIRASHAAGTRGLV